MFRHSNSSLPDTYVCFKKSVKIAFSGGLYVEGNGFVFAIKGKIMSNEGVYRSRDVTG